ncbi:unnamed protein product [Closterium sp. Naga37s-1]|nr:unnamed protein product [Closterium sp. Naga37s-1]
MLVSFPYLLLVICPPSPPAHILGLHAYRPAHAIRGEGSSDGEAATGVAARGRQRREALQPRADPTLRCFQSKRSVISPARLSGSTVLSQQRAAVGRRTAGSPADHCSPLRDHGAMHLGKEQGGRAVSPVAGSTLRRVSHLLLLRLLHCTCGMASLPSQLMSCRGGAEEMRCSGSAAGVLLADPGSAGGACGLRWMGAVGGMTHGWRLHGGQRGGAAVEAFSAKSPPSFLQGFTGGSAAGQQWRRSLLNPRLPSFLQGFTGGSAAGQQWRRSLLNPRLPSFRASRGQRGGAAVEAFSAKSPPSFLQGFTGGSRRGSSGGVLC